MAKQAIHQILQQIFTQVINTGDLSLVDTLFTEDFVDHDPRTLPGREGFKQGLLAIRSAFPDWTVTLEDFLIEDEQIAGRWMARGTHLGPFLGLSPTGRRIAMKEMGIFRFADGQLAEAWRVADELSLMQQLGAAPLFGSPFVPEA